MPLPKDMAACMHKAKEEFPNGRSKKKMGKKKAQKQRVAMCMNASEARQMSFKDYLTETA